MVFQAEATECGMSCLAMVAGYYGQGTDLVGMRVRFRMPSQGVSLQRMVEIARDLGLSAEAVRLELDDLRDVPTPAILHWRMSHYVVLKSIKRGVATIHDPSVGIRKVPLSVVSDGFTGIALLLEPGATFVRRSTPPRMSICAMLASVNGLGRALGQVAVLAVLLELATIVAPLFIQIVTDNVVQKGDYALLGVVGAAFVALRLFQSVVAAIRSWAVVRLSANLGWLWSTNTFAHLMTLPEDFFQRRKLGEVLSRFGSISQIQQTVTSRFVETILDGIMAVATTVVMYRYEPTLASLTLLVVMAYAVLRYASYGMFREAGLSQLAADAHQQSALLESLRGARAVRLHNMAIVQAMRFATMASESMRKFVTVQRLGIGSTLVGSLLLGAQSIGTLWIGAKYVLDGSLTVGMLVAFVGYSSQFTQRCTSAVDYLSNLRMLRMHTERLGDIVLATPEADMDGAGILLGDALGIELVNVSFRYSEDEPWIIKDCNLKIDPGESVAIVGASGSGKTTLMKIMLGLLEPQSGEVLVNGSCLARVGKKAFRDRLGVVMEDDELFSGTLAQNISFFDPAATIPTIQVAAVRAAIHEDIRRMPLGYDTLVGDMGNTLSGGQRQRILLARALYRQPSMLLLDEATSRLDATNESLVSAVIRKLNITRVLIAHRRETIDSADRQIHVATGGVVSSVNAEPVT